MSQAGSRLRAARIRSGKSPEELANACRISSPAYYDLEQFNDLNNTISIAELAALCKALGIRIIELFADDNATVTNQKGLTFTDLALVVKTHLDERRQSLDDFENDVGWEIAAFFQAPDSAWNWNIDCLRDVCLGCGVDWLSVLPP